MKIKMMKALWGMKGTYRELFERASAAGYAGIEAPLPEVDQAIQFKQLLDEFQLDYIAQTVTYGNHIETFKEQVSRAVEFEPLLIVSHSARDGMPFEEQARFFGQALDVEREVGIPIGHETHRSRAMFTPWSTSRLLREFPELKITADFSHWCCVCESLLEDQFEHLEIAMQRAIHIHGRVGYAQGPQVPHPGAPEYEQELAAFETWWKRICALRAEEGASFMTITPEFGPPGYMHTLPYVNQPVVDLWGVNFWMTERLRKTLQESEK